MVRVLTKSERAIMEAILANKRTIKQLRLTNRALQELLPKYKAGEPGRVKDPRSGEKLDYEKGGAR